MNVRCGCVIPVYRHFRELAELLPRISEYFSDEAIVIVDDGSGEDFSLPPLPGGKRAVLLRHDRNLGKGAALLTGLKALKARGYSHALCMDADGQHSPDDIPKFLARAGEADILIGDRMGDLSAMPFERRLSNKMTSALVRLRSGLPVRDSQNGFRLVKIDAVLDLNLSSGGFQFESEMLLKGGARGLTLINIPVKTIYSGAFSAIRHVADTMKFIRLYLKRY